MPTTEERYFAASNSCNGFVNYFNNIFAGLDKIYIIKGGPGTGKSKLMRDIAGEAENRGHCVEYYYCSADDNSLDGIIVRSLKFGVLDGTSPHIYEPELPGSVEELINLGDFWRGDILHNSSRRISALVTRKNELFTYVYAYLAASEKISACMRQITESCINSEKLSGAVSRIFKSIHDGNGINEEIRLTSCIGMNGCVHFDTFSKLAERSYIIHDRYHTAQMLLAEIRRQAILHSHHMYYSVSPINSNILDEIYLPEANIAFVTTETTDKKAGDKIINMSRFIDEEAVRHHRIKLRFMSHCVESLDNGALAELTEIKSVHFNLEDIYKEAMDFKRKEEFTKKLLIRIF